MLKERFDCAIVTNELVMLGDYPKLVNTLGRLLALAAFHRRPKELPSLDAYLREQGIGYTVTKEATDSAD